MIKYYRAMTWLQVILQASIPLLTTVTPVAKASLHIEELAMCKKIHTLAQGENVSTVAQRESLTPDQLWLLNHYLFPSRESFEHAGAGDVISLPYSGQDTQSVRSEQKNNNPEQTRYASLASRSGARLAAKRPGKALSLMLVKVASYDYQCFRTQLAITPQRLPADGQSEAVIQWRINTLYDRPVRGLAKKLKLILRTVSRSGQLAGTLTTVEEPEPGDIRRCSPA